MEAIQTNTIEAQLVMIDEYLMDVIRKIKESSKNQERLSLQMKANYLSDILSYNEEILVDVDEELTDEHDMNYVELINLYDYVFQLMSDEEYIKEHILKILRLQAYFIDTLDVPDVRLEEEFVNFFNKYATEFLGEAPLKNYEEYQGERDYYEIDEDVKVYMSKDRKLEEILNDESLKDISLSMKVITHLNQQLLTVLGN